MHIRNQTIGYTLSIMFIAIEGNIGSGKSTLLRQLKKQYPFVIVCEEDISSWNSYEVDNIPILEAFYKNKEAHAFTLQMAILLSRIKTLIKYHEMNQLVFMERSIFADVKVFCKMLNENDAIISNAQMKIVEDWVNTFSKFCSIQMYIYLDVPVDTCMKRVSIRDRAGETQISEGYLKELREKHDEWFCNEDFTVPMMCLNDNQEEDVELIMQFIENHFVETHPLFKRT